MSAIVMGIKGKDYIVDLQRNDFKMYDYGQRRIDITGPMTYGWSFVVNVFASFLIFVSCILLALDYKLIPGNINDGEHTVVLPENV